MLSRSSSAALRRVPTSLLLVGGLHLIVVWALINGLHIRLAGPERPSDIVASMIEPAQPPPEHIVAPAVPQTQVNYTPTPIVPVVTVPPMDDGMAITQEVLPGIQEPTQPALAEPEPVITGAAVDPRHPLSQPEYPPSAVRSGEEGKLALQVLVGADGRVVDVKVARSSGSPRLDQAAVSEARSHWRLRPATRDGVPFAQWLTLGVVFRLAGR